MSEIWHASLWFPGFFFALSGNAHAHHLSSSVLVPHWNVVMWSGLGLLLAVEALFVARLTRRGDARRLERVWTIMPLTVLMALLLVRMSAAYRVSAEIADAGPDALHIEVTARQWHWSFRYAAENFVSESELHVPAGRAVQLRLSSRDVLHSFDVPQLGLRHDILPRSPSTLAFLVDRPGRYEIVCSALCGNTAQEMWGVIAVDPPHEYTVWVAEHNKNRLGKP